MFSYYFLPSSCSWTVCPLLCPYFWTSVFSFHKKGIVFSRISQGSWISIFTCFLGSSENFTWVLAHRATYSYMWVTVFLPILRRPRISTAFGTRKFTWASRSRWIKIKKLILLLSYGKYWYRSLYNSSSCPTFKTSRPRISAALKVRKFLEPPRRLFE